MSAQKKVDRWKAVRKGRIYCAPACGHNCTYLDYLKAQHRAKEVAEKLGLGNGWTFEVWENLGWHSKVISPDKYVSVYIHPGAVKDTYMVMIGPSKDGSALPGWHYTADSVEEALNGAFEKVHAEAIRMMSFLSAVLAHEYWPRKKRKRERAT